MTGFIGLRPKCYAFKIHGDDKEYKKCKGTAKNIVKRQIKYDDYNKVLELEMQLYIGHLIALGVKTTRFLVLILQQYV